MKARAKLSTLDPGRAATGELLRALAPDVRRWVHRHLGPGPDLDDATQEALIEIADALGRFEGRAKLTTYARRIAVRAAYRYRRRHPPLPTTDLVVVDDRRTPEQIAMQRQSLSRLYAGLDLLSPKLRSAFILCDVERVSHAEAAQIAEVSLDALQARLKRARVKLRAHLAKDPGFASLFGGAR